MFQDTITGDEPVALAHIDGDWYESVRTCLERIGPRLSPGGVMVIDDYFYWSGCRTAVDEFLAKHPDDYRTVRRRTACTSRRSDRARVQAVRRFSTASATVEPSLLLGGVASSHGLTGSAQWIRPGSVNHRARRHAVPPLGHDGPVAARRAKCSTSRRVRPNSST